MIAGGRTDFDDSDETLVATRLALATRGVIEPLADDDDDARRWLDWELASLVEGHFQQIVDVSALPPRERLHWERRVTSRDSGLRDPRREKFRTVYWLLHNGERV